MPGPLDNRSRPGPSHLVACHLNAKGFTLIEVVIAVAIFAMAATVLISGFTNALLAREHGVNQDQFNADLRSVRMQLLLEPDIDEATRGGRFEMLGSGRASWEARIEPTSVVDLFQVDFRVIFENPPKGLPANYEETLYLLRPTWSDRAERSDLLQRKREELNNLRGRLTF